MPNRRAILWLLLGLSIVRGFLYAAIIPPWQAPDEHQHFEYAKLISLKHQLVTYKDRSPELQREIIYSMDRYEFWRFGRINKKVAEALRRGNLPQSFSELGILGYGSHLHQPPLYYLLGAIVISVVPTHDIALQLFLMRLMSPLFYAFTVWLAYKLAVLLFPEDIFLQIGIPAFILFLPMYTYMAGVVNNDHIGELVSSVVVYLLAVSLRRGFSPSRTFLILIALVAGYYGKRTFFFTVPLIPLALFLRYVSYWRKVMPGWARMMLPLGVMLGITGTVIFAGSERLSKWWSVIYTRLSLNNPLDVKGMIEVLNARYALYGQRLFQSFWARFGLMNIALASFWYMALAIVTLGSVVGLCIFAYRVKTKRALIADWQKHILLLYGAAILAITVMVTVNGLAVAARWARSGVLYMPQGRYLFPAILPIATLFSLGLRQFVPNNRQFTGLLAYLMGLVAFDLVCIIGYILPFFYS